MKNRKGKIIRLSVVLLTMIATIVVRICDTSTCDAISFLTISLSLNMLLFCKVSTRKLVPALTAGIVIPIVLTRSTNIEYVAIKTGLVIAGALIAWGIDYILSKRK